MKAHAYNSTHFMNRQFFILTLCLILITFFTRTYGQCIVNAGNDTTLCVTFGLDTVYLGGTPTVIGGTPPYTYTWTCNYSMLNTVFFTASDFLDDTTSANPRVNEHNGDTLSFYLTVSDNAGNSCSDSVVIHFCGDYVWSLGWNFVYINQGDTAQISPSVAQGCSPLSFQWFPIYNISDPDVEYPLVWPDTTTHYYVIVSDAADCQASGGTFDVFVVPVGIDEQEQKPILLKIFPNPLTDNSTIIVDADNAQIIFYDIFGRAIQQVTVKKSTEIKRTDFNAGIYYYRVFDKNIIVGHGKLIVQ